MTDPRFYEWLWNMENEIRPLIPMIYHHVWDNYPYPKFNQKFYESNDHIACISKTTYDIVKKVAPSVDCSYMPHAVDSDIFKKLPDDVRKEILPTTENKFVIFWNNRNARRKMSGTLIFWFKEFIDKIGHDKAVLVMHTDPKDPNGQDLEKILIDLELLDGQVLISNQNVSSGVLAKFYNAADLTTTISDAEGFGLNAIESLSCGTPILTSYTGGLKDQVTDGKNQFGRLIKPCSRAVVGSQQVPYIYEDRISKESFLKELNYLYKKWKNNKPAYNKLGELGQKHVDKNFNFTKFEQKWVDIVDNVYKRCGSWENRKGYESWKIKEMV